MSISPIAAAVQGLSSQASSANQSVSQGAGASSVADVPATTRATPQAVPKPVDAAQLHQAIDDANRQLEQESLNLQYSIDKDTKETIVKLVNTQSGEVIRQIPSQEMLAIAKQIDKALASRSGFAVQTEV
jgi:flagellar protein FlaG